MAELPLCATCGHRHRKRDPHVMPDAEVERVTVGERSIVISEADLDKLTAARIAGLHLDRIFTSYDIGEVELLMMFLHLLHARRSSLNPDDIDARRSDFEEQMKLVFDGEPA